MSVALAARRSRAGTNAHAKLEPRRYFLAGSTSFALAQNSAPGSGADQPALRAEDTGSHVRLPHGFPARAAEVQAGRGRAP
jgi:hypothetical protein